MAVVDGPEHDAIDGRVDRLDEIFGVSGWAIDRRDPGARLTIELWAGDALIDTTTTGAPRRDVCEALGLEGQPGYAFDADVRARILTAAAGGAVGDLCVRVADHPEPLQSVAARRSLELVRTGNAAQVPANRDVLIDRLTLHARAARDTFDQPMRPMPGYGVGFVEAIAVDDAGLTWVVGWIRHDELTDRPLVILDNGKHAAGFAYVMVERADLPPDSRGFIGILHTDWRASTDLPPYFFLADGSTRFLESLLPTPIRSKQAIAPIARDMLARAEGGYRDLLRDLFHSTDIWQVDGAASKDLLHVDEVAILSGFGALVTGWALSPSRRADRLVLKAGNRIMVADEASVARQARPDLHHIYGNVDLALARAGFTATFRGDLSEARIDEMVLKGGWTDGTATNTAIAPDRVRILGVTAPLDRALAFYPAIEAERFFPDFAHHAAANTRAQAGSLQTYEANPALAALVIAAPMTASDLALTIDGALRHAASMPPAWGIVIVAQPDRIRGTLIAHFADLKRATRRPCSLFFTDANEATNDVLGEVIAALGLERVGFIGSGTTLTAAGWAGLGARDEDLTLFEVIDLAADPSGAGSIGLDAFACDAASWGRIVRAAEPRIGGLTLAAADAAGIPPHRIVPRAALSLGTRRPSALVGRINAIGLADHD